ncbi:hypothetical protein BRAS3843_1260038 [Bradyrhizobium sp. STM 3843]|nr:hypothetical protein BRAS3843_1260038 [Bradyrhizobium sp. STM 3843]
MCRTHSHLCRSAGAGATSHNSESPGATGRCFRRDDTGPAAIAAHDYGKAQLTFESHTKSSESHTKSSACHCRRANVSLK